MAELDEIAQAWVDEDPDPHTRDEGAALIAAGDPEVLREHFGRRLAFGTAGLRGPCGPGPNRMNRALVIRVSRGLADWVLQRAEGDGPIVVGFDGRTGSETFARDTASVLAGAGLPVCLFDTVCATPLLAFAVRELGARAGVMITASHNPPADNGYKVFWSDGGQIVPPHDVGISGCIDRVGPLASVPRRPHDALRDEGVLTSVPAGVVEAYLAAVLAVRVHPTGPPLEVVYTALHGVGWRLLSTLFERAGRYRLHPVASQRDPDGRFPTVAFPNPEEPGAMDLALALGAQVHADVVIANDPDADRLAVAVPDPDGGYRTLNGNELGVLLAHDLLAHGPGPGQVVATTVVSSSLLGRIAEAHGATCVETLTGFKWIARAADGHGMPLRFGYEEALGYSVGGIVRDKDGVSAALIWCDLVAHLQQQGRTVLDQLDALALEHGVHHTTQRSIVLPGPSARTRIDGAMALLRTEPPRALGGSAVAAVRDLQRGQRAAHDGTLETIALPPSNVLTFELEGGHRVHVRPSGTEPKLKVYGEAVQPVGEAGLSVARAQAAQVADRLVDDLVERTGLRPLD